MLETVFCRSCGKLLTKGWKHNQKNFCSIKCKNKDPEFASHGAGSISRHYNDVANGRIKRVPMRNVSEA